MSSDNGKAGEIDWYDVWAVADYIERKYSGTVQINCSAATSASRPTMLLCASFVGNESVWSRGAGCSHEVPLLPWAMREVPRVAHELLLTMQEAIDDLRPGEIKLTFLEP